MTVYPEKKTKERGTVHFQRYINPSHRVTRKTIWVGIIGVGRLSGPGNPHTHGPPRGGEGDRVAVRFGKMSPDLTEPISRRRALDDGGGGPSRVSIKIVHLEDGRRRYKKMRRGPSRTQTEVLRERDGSSCEIKEKEEASRAGLKKEIRLNRRV